ncbi:MAG: hypothetical protein ACI9KN_000742 [Gammaproteobacteria bacterium]|jgi:hypothetical protein
MRGMFISRKKITKEKVQWIWTILLSLGLLFGHSANLHVHSFDYASEKQPSRISVTGVDDHSHQVQTHLSTDMSHSDHHAVFVPEIDTSLNVLLKFNTGKVLTLALLFTMLVYFSPCFYQYLIHRRRNNDTISSWRYHFFPPLRAPPL